MWLDPGEEMRCEFGPFYWYLVRLLLDPTITQNGESRGLEGERG